MVGEHAHLTQVRVGVRGDRRTVRGAGLGVRRLDLRAEACNRGIIRVIGLLDVSVEGQMPVPKSLALVAALMLELAT